MPINDFTVVKKLGSGAYSTVSLVTRKQDQKIYALKCVQISKLSPIERQNSLNEISLLASINHKNIISYKESFYNEENHTLNIILEYADDGDLQTKIISKKKFGCFFEEKTIWSLFIQMVKGLNELHKRKIIHRDLKSANIFLMKNGICKLGDLNVAKVVENGLLTTQTGTPYFASPEIWEDKPYNFKSDIWSIGCILYQMAGLKMPFQGKNIKEVYYNLKNVNIPPLPDMYSNDIIYMVKKLLKINPDDRPTTQEILDDDIIKNKMKMVSINGNDLMDISLDINNFQKVKNKTKLIKSIKVNDDKNLNYVLPKKNYFEKEFENLYFFQPNEKMEFTEENINHFKKNKKINYKYDFKIQKHNPKKNFSFNEDKIIKKKNINKNINSLINIESNDLPRINPKQDENKNKNIKPKRTIKKRECNSAKYRKDINHNNTNDIITRNTNKELNEIENKNNTARLQYKKIVPKNNYKKNNYYLYIRNNQMIESISDNEIQKNFGTTEDTMVNYENNLIYKNKLLHKIKRVNSFLLVNRTKINELKQNNKINKNNSQYIFPMVNNNKICLKGNFAFDNKINNLTLELNNNNNINTSKNDITNFDLNNQEKIKYEFNYKNGKGKKLIPNHPLKFEKKEFNNNQLKCYYKSHNNIEQENENSNFKNIIIMY